jgi:WASH complex subunit strumpellin
MFQRCAQDDSGSLKSKRDDNHGGRKPCIQSELLSRISIPTTFVNRIIECLVSVDLYPSQSYAFPSFHHRSSKFGQQSAMLLIILFFDECSLKHNTNLMRQVVDKFIHDTWIIPLYNGSVIDLSLEWNQQYPAAMNAINHVIASENVRQLNYTTMKMILSNLDEVQRYLAPKILTTAFLLDYGSSILDFLRGANAALRWQILHRNSHLCPKAEDDDTSAMLVDEHDILSLILLVSQLEVQLVEAYQQILLKKEAIWSNCKVVIIDKVDCLSKYFFGNDSLKVAEKDDDLGKWFENMVDEITLIDFNADKTGGQIQMTMEALDEVKQLDLIDSSLPSIAIIEEAQKNLVHMAKVANIEHDICETINFISDFTYAREILESLVPLLHSKSMKDPKSVTLLRAFFIKMGKDIPNLRLHSLAERQQNDLNYVTEFHEAAMLSFVKEILDVIPITIFSTLAHIADEKSLALLPAKIEADRLIEYLHFKDRYNVSKITYELSILTKGEPEIIDESLSNELSQSNFNVNSQAYFR